MLSQIDTASCGFAGLQPYNPHKIEAKMAAERHTAE